VLLDLLVAIGARPGSTLAELSNVIGVRLSYDQGLKIRNTAPGLVRATRWGAVGSGSAPTSAGRGRPFVYELTSLGERFVAALRDPEAALSDWRDRAALHHIGLLLRGNSARDPGYWLALSAAVELLLAPAEPTEIPMRTPQRRDDSVVILSEPERQAVLSIAFALPYERYRAVDHPALPALPAGIPEIRVWDRNEVAPVFARLGRRNLLARLITLASAREFGVRGSGEPAIYMIRQVLEEIEGHIAAGRLNLGWFRRLLVYEIYFYRLRGDRTGSGASAEDVGGELLNELLAARVQALPAEIAVQGTLYYAHHLSIRQLADLTGTSRFIVEQAFARHGLWLRRHNSGGRGVKVLVGAAEAAAGIWQEGADPIGIARRLGLRLDVVVDALVASGVPAEEIGRQLGLGEQTATPIPDRPDPAVGAELGELYDRRDRVHGDAEELAAIDRGIEGLPLPRHLLDGYRLHRGHEGSPLSLEMVAMRLGVQGRLQYEYSRWGIPVRRVPRWHPTAEERLEAATASALPGAAVTFDSEAVVAEPDSEAMLAGLREFADDFGHAPTAADWRRSGRSPGYGDYIRLFGSWTGALREAGLQSVRRRYSDTELLRALAAAQSANPGRPLSRNAYKRWRADHESDAPDWQAITQRLGGGSWLAAIRRLAKVEPPALLDDPPAESSLPELPEEVGRWWDWYRRGLGTPDIAALDGTTSKIVFGAFRRYRLPTRSEAEASRLSAALDRAVIAAYTERVVPLWRDGLEPVEIAAALGLDLRLVHLALRPAITPAEFAQRYAQRGITDP
jgi:hypothetical protein